MKACGQAEKRKGKAMKTRFIEQGGLTFSCHENGRKYNSVAIEQKDFGIIGHVIDLEGETSYRILRALNERDELLEVLEELTEWGRTYTSPRDQNSPHALLVKACEAIAKAKGE